MNDTATETVETADLELYEPTLAAPGLFGTSDPVGVIERVRTVARALDDVIRDRKLSTKIGGGEHVNIEGWRLLGAMLGVFSRTVSVDEVDNGWRARVEVCTLDGQIVSAAESECLRGERKWRNADDFAVMGMAQTRAASRAFRQALGFVVELAGYSATPADEMPADEPARAGEAIVSKPTQEQMQRIGSLLVDLEATKPGIDWRQKAREIAGCPGDKMTPGVASVVIDKLEEILAELEQAA
jgi:hypothetical protein